MAVGVGEELDAVRCTRGDRGRDISAVGTCLLQILARVGGCAPEGVGAGTREGELVGGAGCPGVESEFPFGAPEILGVRMGDGGYGGGGDGLAG